jgi:hypothetical protein
MTPRWWCWLFHGHWHYDSPLWPSGVFRCVKCNRNWSPKEVKQ